MTEKRRPFPARLVTVRRADRTADGVMRLDGPRSAADALRNLIGDKDREHFVALHVDAKNQVLSAEIVGIGTLMSCLVHPREVFKAAIISGAAAIVCGHNHPSGDVRPSREDIDIEKRLRDAGELLGIRVLDFIIVTDTGHWSSQEASPR